MEEQKREQRGLQEQKLLLFLSPSPSPSLFPFLLALFLSLSASPSLFLLEGLVALSLLWGFCLLVFPLLHYPPPPRKQRELGRQQQ